MQRDSFRKVFLPIYFLMLSLVPRVYLIGKISAFSSILFSISRDRRSMKISSLRTREWNFTSHASSVIMIPREKRERKGNNSVEFRIMFFEGREKKEERERKCRNERKMENPTVRENLKFYQMESIREPLPPRFISNDGKVYSKVYSHYKYLFFP